MSGITAASNAYQPPLISQPLLYFIRQPAGNGNQPPINQPLFGGGAAAATIHNCCNHYNATLIRYVNVNIIIIYNDSDIANIGPISRLAGIA